MLRRGEAPFLECSSAGDARFSAFYARLDAYGGRSIEEIYQGAKRFENGRTGLSWREAKGRRPTNPDEVEALYFDLWVAYLQENPGLLPVLLEATGVSDRFGQEGRNCQADVLWRIRSEFLLELAELEHADPGARSP